ncbi:signal recognition particle-docking protein FtsY [Candidatus Woesearchaeota archaeon]|nr:signal recognition particle-docking protein FtsY [Candidatus Woesearchaeota archaeon]
MFKFLKDKLKKAVSKFSKNVEEEVEEKIEKKEDIIEEPIEVVKEEPKVEEKVEEKEAEEELEEPIVEEEPEPEEEPEEPEEPEEKEIEEEKEEVEHAPLIYEKKEEKKPEPKQIIKPVEEVLEKPKPKAEPKAEQKPTVVPEPIAEEKPIVEEKKPKEKKGFFRRITDTVTKTSISEEKFDKIFWELELALMESNIAIEVIEKIKEDLKRELVESKISRTGIEDTIKNTLTKSISDLFDVGKINLLQKIEQKRERPYVIAFVGINGVGKTTTLAKLANYLKKNGKNVVIAAGDTFRVAAIEQVEEHANRLGIKLIKQDYGSDSAAVCYDAIMHAKAKDMDVVLIDTAGRSHANTNLMDELKKVIKVAKPDLVLFVGDALTGNDAVEQAKEFQDAVGIDGIVLAKADVDEKGGCAVSISYVTKKPIVFLGMGQSYDDLKEFSPEIVLENLGLV